MRKIIFLIIFFIPFITYSETVNKYKESLVHTFSINGKNDIGLLTDFDSVGINETGPSAMTFDADDNLIVCDTVNKRILIFNKDFDLYQMYNDSSYLSGAFYIKVFDDYIWGSLASSRHFILNRTTEKSTEISINYSISNDDTTVSIFIGNILFSYLKDGTIVSYLLEDEYNLKYSKMFFENDTIDLFNEKEKYGLTGYELDSNKRIIYNNGLMNKDYKTMYSYWDEQHKKNNEKAPRKVLGVPDFENLSKANSIFIGKDADGNIYRSGNTGCIIFDKNGWVLDYFKLNNYQLVKPAVDSSGNIYYLSRIKTKDEYMLNLYKIERQW